MGIEKKKTIYEERLYDMIRIYTVSDIDRIINAKIQAAGW